MRRILGRNRRVRSASLREFWFFLWRVVLWLPRGIISALLDDLLVALRLKWRPSTGDARWRWDRPRPDPAAGTWQRHLRSEATPGDSREPSGIDERE